MRSMPHARPPHPNHHFASRLLRGFDLDAELPKAGQKRQMTRRVHFAEPRLEVGGCCKHQIGTDELRPRRKQCNLEGRMVRRERSNKHTPYM